MKNTPLRPTLPASNTATRLRELLGYDLLVPDNSLDRDPVEFVRLLHQYQRESNLIQIN